MERKWSYHKWWCCCFWFRMAWAMYGGAVVKLCSCNFDVGLVVHSFGFYYCSISGPRKVCAFICRDMKVFYEPHVSHIISWIKHFAESCFRPSYLNFPYHFLSHSIWHFDWNLAFFHDKTPIPSTWNKCMLQYSSQTHMFHTISVYIKTADKQFIQRNLQKAYFTLDSPPIFLPAKLSEFQNFGCPLSMCECECFMLFYTLWSYFIKRFFFLFMFYAFVSSI